MSAPHRPIVPFRYPPSVLAGLIYGIVTAMAIMTVVSTKSSQVLFIAGAGLSTSLMLALTHFYAAWLAGSHSPDSGHGGAGGAWRSELPTLLGPFVLGAVMVVLSSLGVEAMAAVEAAMWLGTSMLFVLGFRIALQSGRGYLAAVGFGLLDAAIGALLVLVKVLMH